MCWPAQLTVLAVNHDLKNNPFNPIPLPESVIYILPDIIERKGFITCTATHQQGVKQCLWLTSLSGCSCISHLYIQSRVNLFFTYHIIYYVSALHVKPEIYCSIWMQFLQYWHRAAREIYTNNWKSVREYWVSSMSDCSDLSKANLLCATRAYTQGFEKQVQTSIWPCVGLHPRKPAKDKAGV